MQSSQIRRVCNFLSLYRIQQINQDTLVLHSPINNLLVKNHRITSQDFNACDEILELLDRHLSLDPQYICPLIHFDVDRSQSDGQQIIRTIYQMDKVTLKQQIARRRAQGNQFSEEDIWIIVSSLVNSLIYLQDQGVMYGALSNNKIFVEDKIRLMDPTSFNLNSIAVSRLSLHSPEISANQSQIDFNQSDVYLLALCIIQATTLSQINNRITAEELSALMNVTAQCYSQELMHVLKFMLRKTASQRPTFQNIKQFVQQQIQIRQAKLKICPNMPEDMQDQICCSPELSSENQKQIIDILEPDPNECALSDFQLAKQKYLFQSSIKQQKGNLSLTHCDTNCLNSLQNIDSILKIDRQIVRKRRQSCIIRQFKLSNTNATVVKNKKMDRLHMIKKRNGQTVNLVSKIIPSYFSMSEKAYSTPQIMDILKQQTNRANQFIQAHSRKINL